MNARQKEVLVQHRAFLTRNIVWTDSLANRLLAQGVITESTIKLMNNNTKNGKDRLGQFLDAVVVRAGTSLFDKLCNTLYLHGHPFVADFLREEEMGTEGLEVRNIRDLYTLVPVISKVLKDSEKKTLETYIVEKANEAHLRHTWAKEKIAKEKDKAIEAKKMQLEDAFDYEIKEKMRNEVIANLQNKIEELKKEKIELNSSLDFVKSQIQATENKFKSDFDVQMKFSVANENAVQRLQEKYNRSQKSLLEIEQKLQHILNTPPRTSERDQMALTEFQFAFVSRDLDSFIDKYNLLLQIEKQYDALLHERNYILSHLGVHHGDENKPSLLDAYRDFAVKTDEDLTHLKAKLEKHTDVIEEREAKINVLNKEVEMHHEKGKAKNAGTVWQNAIMNVMRKQLSESKHENRIKDTKLKHFESEISKLKARIAELESRRGSEAGHSHHKHGQKNAAGSDLNGMTSITPSGINEDAESFLSRSDESKKRSNLLPPLGSRILFQAENIPAPVQTSPRKSKLKAPGTISFSNGPPAPEGLLTSPVKLETRGYVGQPIGSGKMTHGLGNLKFVHGKVGK